MSEGDKALKPFEAWVQHQNETAEPQEAQVFFAYSDPRNGEPIGWCCLTCGKTYGEIPA